MLTEGKTKGGMRPYDTSKAGPRPDDPPPPIPVESVPSASTNMPRDEIRLLAESIVSCINGGQYDNAKVLAESIIAELSPVG